MKFLKITLITLAALFLATGYVAAQGTISGVVFNDSNGDGSPAGEEVEEGVTVELVNAAGKVIATAVTGADGAYSFINVPVGEGYILRFTYSSGLTVQTKAFSVADGEHVRFNAPVVEVAPTEESPFATTNPNLSVVGSGAVGGRESTDFVP